MQENYVVYKHTSPSGKVYIGITNRNPSIRWGKNGRQYLNKQKNGEYAHRFFANAILKYGWNHIKHEILFTNLSRKEACEKEVKLIALYKSKGMSYNITDGGDGHTTVILSKASRRRLSESHKGLKQSKETIERRVSQFRGKERPMHVKLCRSKEVQQFSISGEYIASYYSVREAERKTGINSAHIGDCCNNKPNRITAGGYKWKYKQTD